MSINIERVKTKNFSMGFFRFGKGEKTLVILPGVSVKSVMDSADIIEKDYQIMEGDFTVYVFDRRKELPLSYTVKDMALDTIEAFKALDLTDIYLFGASQGGMIALEIAINFPGIVKKLALGSTTAYINDERFSACEKWIELANKRDGVGLYLDFCEKLYPSNVFEAYRDAFISVGKTVTEEEFKRFIAITEAMKSFNVVESLNKIECPTLAIGSKDDAVLGPDSTQEIAEKLKAREDFEFYLYDGYGHAAFDTAPDYKEKLLAFFLK